MCTNEETRKDISEFANAPVQVAVADRNVFFMCPEGTNSHLSSSVQGNSHQPGEVIRIEDCVEVEEQII